VPGNLELVKPNQKELSALVNRELTQPDDVRTAAQELVRSGKARRVVVSLALRGRWPSMKRRPFRLSHRR
jgi:6-phosphofructokinase 2